MKRRKRNLTPKNAAVTIEMAVEQFSSISPEFQMRWMKAQDFYEEQAMSMVFLVFPADILNKLAKDPTYDFRKILQLTEKLVCEGNKQVQNVMYTFFIESLLIASDKSPSVMAPVLRNLGKESRAYALEWNNSIGKTNLGLDRGCRA